jgi:glycine/D-amino acid oxidase-like deaminating enzyme
MSTSKKRIVILGAGYAGIFLATHIARYVTEKERCRFLLSTIMSKTLFVYLWLFGYRCCRHQWLNPMTGVSLSAAVLVACF